MITCNACFKTKDFSEYHKKNGSKTGYAVSCKSCVKTHLRKWRIQNRQKVRDYANDYYRSVYGKAVKMVVESRIRARKKGLEFDLTTEFVAMLLTHGKCAKSGLEFANFEKANGKRNPFAPAIDRIDNSKGYTPGNVQIVCNMYNMGKSEFDENDFIKMCIGVVKRRNELGLPCDV